LGSNSRLTDYKSDALATVPCHPFTYTGKLIANTSIKECCKYSILKDALLLKLT